MKRFLALLMIASLLFSSLVFVSAAAEIKKDDSYTLGDVDGSGAVNSADSLIVKLAVAGALDSDCDRNAADFNADGRISTDDSIMLKYCISGRVSFAEFESDTNVYRLLIGGYDISDFCIVVPEGATREDNAHFAAEQMRKYIEIATGVELEICYGSESRTKDHAIVYHMEELDSEIGREIGYEGYKYDITGGDLNIYGTARGNMYCTYDLLERVGFVFYSDDYTFIYETRLVKLEEGEEITFVPRLRFRMDGGSNFRAGGGENHFFAQKLNGSQLYQQEDNTRTGTLTGPRFINAHSYSYYWRMATGTYTDDDHLYECWLSGEQKQESDYAETPPWQPCATSDSDYEKLMLGLDRTITMLEKRGHKFTDGISAMSFSIADNQKGYCQCTKCKKISKGSKDNPWTPGDDSSPAEGYSGLYISLTNRAARDIKVLYPEYPNLKLMSIIYDHTIPATVRPEENVIIFFCGQGCNNHNLGTTDCDGHPPLVHELHNTYASEALKTWAQYCHDAGAEIWFWYYPVSFLFYMAPCPNTLKLYEDFDFIINECGVDGFYFECGGRNYAFEPLKAHMSSEFIYNPDMTKEEYTDIMMEYLYIYFGKGYKNIYKYLEMQDIAGSPENCYLNNFSYPQEMYDMEYIAENYEEMRSLIVEALAMTDNEEEIEHLEKLLVTCDFTGLSGVHEDWYKNGTNKEEYVANYDEMCDLIEKYGMRPSTFGTDENPEQLDFDDYEKSPFDQLC